MLMGSQTNPSFRQVYMWVGSQTSQVEIKLSLKACQVSCVCAVVLVRHPAGGSSLTPVSTSCLCSAGLHPAHALKRRRTPQKTAASPKGKRAPLLHTMLPRLGCFQKSPLLNQFTQKGACVSAAMLFSSNTMTSPPHHA